MKYAIFSNEEKKYEFETEKEAAEQMDRMRLKEKKIVKIPEPRVGLKLFKKGILYGVIASETESLWHIQKRGEGPDTPNSPMIKENYENHFLSGRFDQVEEYLNLED